MKKELTRDQKILAQQLSDLKQNSWWQIIVQSIDDRLEYLQKILTGEIDIQDKEKPNQIENLDEIKYSKSSILRAEHKVLSELKWLPDKLIKWVGIYTQ
jgi:hypothetical protein